MKVEEEGRRKKVSNQQPTTNNPKPTKNTTIIKKVRKGAWRMPWLMEAKKDVISCDKPWVGANNL